MFRVLNVFLSLYRTAIEWLSVSFQFQASCVPIFLGNVKPVDALRAAIVPRPLDGMRLNAVSSTGLKTTFNHF